MRCLRPHPYTCILTRLCDSNRQPWFSTTDSYNPAIHRVKQAQYHAAIVKDLNRQPVPPPYEELLKYFEPPRRVLKRAREAVEECKRVFNVREGTFEASYVASYSLTPGQFRRRSRECGRTSTSRRRTTTKRCSGSSGDTFSTGGRYRNRPS